VIGDVKQYCVFCIVNVQYQQSKNGLKEVTASAKTTCLVIGHADTLSHAHGDIPELLRDAKNKDLIMSAEQVYKIIR
jgi:hypothetical protein